MPKATNPFRKNLYLTDGGLETTLIFHQGIHLNYFAAFPLLDDDSGKKELRKYYEPYLQLAERRGTGFILETPTWRASPDWAAKLGYSDEKLIALNREAVNFVRGLAEEFGTGIDEEPRRVG